LDILICRYFSFNAIEQYPTEWPVR
jgi:hypothetical protein